jgi:hypothetical protein
MISDVFSGLSQTFEKYTGTVPEIKPWPFFPRTAAFIID